MKEFKESFIKHVITRCPICAKQHEFILKVAVKNDENDLIPLFAGPGGITEVAFTCTEKNKIFTQKINDPENGEIVGVAGNDDLLKAAAQKTDAAPDNKSLIESELEEWVKGSKERTLDYAKTMITTSASAIPVYFVVLKYLGIEKVSMAGISKFSIVIPSFFLIAAVVFVVGLLPKYKNVTRNSFETIRKMHMIFLNRVIIAGTIIFSMGILLSIIQFFCLIN